MEVSVPPIAGQAPSVYVKETGPVEDGLKTAEARLVAMTPFEMRLTTGSVSWICTMESESRSPALVEPSVARTWLVRNNPSAKGSSRTVTVKRMSIVRLASLVLS